MSVREIARGDRGDQVVGAPHEAADRAGEEGAGERRGGGPGRRRIGEVAALSRCPTPRARKAGQCRRRPYPPSPGPLSSPACTSFASRSSRCLRRCTADLFVPVSSAIAHRHPSRQQRGDADAHGLLRVLHDPCGLAVGEVELRLERPGVVAHQAAALLDVHLEARALLDGVVARLAQAERGVEHVSADNPRFRGDRIYGLISGTTGEPMLPTPPLSAILLEAGTKATMLCL